MANSSHSSNTLLIGSSSKQKGTEDLNFKRFFYKFILSKWHFYAISLAFFIGGISLYLKLTDPMYQVTSKVFIKESQPKFPGNPDWINEVQRIPSIDGKIENEIEVLTSFALMQSVVQELDLTKKYYWENDIPKVEGYKGFPIRLDSFSLNPKFKKRSFTLTPGGNSSQFLITLDSLEGPFQFGKWFTTPAGSFLVSKRMDDPFLMDSVLHIRLVGEKKITENLLNDYTVKFADSERSSSTLTLTINDRIPQRGVDVLTQLIEQYSVRKRTENQEVAQQTLQFIDARLNEIGQELSNSGSGPIFKPSNASIGLTDHGANPKEWLENLNKLTDQEKDIEVQLRIIRSMQQTLEQSKTDEFTLLPSSLSLANTKIESLIQPYNKLVLLRKQQILSQQTEALASNNQDLKELRQAIVKTLNETIGTLQKELGMIQEQQASLSGQLNQSAGIGGEVADPTRRREIAENLYTYLLRRKEAMSLAFMDGMSNLTVIDPPRSELEPLGPSKNLLYTGGLLAGFLLPLLFFVGADYIRDTVLDEKEVKRIIPGANIMGLITKFRGKERQVVLRQRKTITAEQFRSLRINIQFLFKRNPKVIMVTSSTSGEGKTFITANLATSYSLTSKKVIVLDFDLYKADLMEYMEEDTEVGLSDYLMGAVWVEDIIKPSQNTPNLDFIGGGPISTFTNELITDEKLSELFTFLKAKYDIIIVDTPPIGIISDAILMNKYVDLSLFVVRSGYTKKEMLKKSRMQLEKRHLANPCIVVNGVQKATTYGYGYKKYEKYLKKGTA